MSVNGGSLFDGIAGFPYAGQKVGIQFIWASEIEPFPITVSKQHFLDMKHLGDITKINGAEIEPVDVITFGSPCQDLSAAGKRAGIGYKCHDCVHEWSYSTTYGIDNNCPNCGSENIELTRSGLFMEAIRIIREMREATNGLYPRFIVWENVPGAFSSNGGYDFQAVLSEISESEIPMPNSGGWAHAGMVRGGKADIAWRVLDAQYWGVPQRRKRIFLVADFGGCGAGEILFKPESLRGDFTKGEGEREGTAGSVAVGVGKSSGIIPATEVCELAIDVANPNNGVNYGKSPTLCSRMGTGGNQVPCVIYPTSNTAPTVTTKWRMVTGGPSNGNECLNMVVCAPSGVIPFDTTQITSPQNGCNPKPGDPCHPLCATAHTPSVAIPFTMQSFGEYKDCGVANCMKARDAKEATDLVVAIQHSIIGRKPEAGAQGAGYREDGKMFTLDSRGAAHCVAAVDCRNLYENIELSATLQSKGSGGFSLNYINPIRQGYRVRRLTPTECERLMGFPDGWTAGGSDTARYKALGNSVAIPCVEFIMSQIAKAISK